MPSPHPVLLMCGPDGLHANVSDVWTLAYLRRRAEACPALTRAQHARFNPQSSIPGESSDEGEACLVPC